MTSSATILTAAAARPVAAPSPRLRRLGAIGLLCAPTFLLASLLAPALGIDTSAGTYMGITSLVYMIGFGCNVVGLRIMRATGQGRGASIFFAVQAALVILALAFAVMEIAGVDGSNPFLRITDIAWPLSHVLMLVAFGMVMKARRIGGWRRFAPLVLGLALPSFIVLGAVGAPKQVAFQSFPVLTAIGGLAIAWTVLRGREAELRL